MKVAAGQEFQRAEFVPEDERIVGRGVELARDQFLGVLQLVAAASMHLRQATEGILILDPGGVFRMQDIVLEAYRSRRLGRAAATLDNATDIFRSRDLPGLLAHEMNAGIERCLLAADRLQTERTGRIGCLHQHLGVMEVENRHGRAEAVAVDEGKAVLRLEIESNWRDA